jgi:acyl-CoA synthetase (AMP-forming)/AMP-acid ligase II/acyl carrier protein
MQRHSDAPRDAEIVRPTGNTVADLLERRAERDPDRVALVVDGGESLTYGRWNAAADACAQGLSERGVEPGDHVALVFDRAAWTAFAIAYCGALKAGAVAVPLSGDRPAAQVREVLRHSRARFLVHSPGLQPPRDEATAIELGEVAGDGSAGPFAARCSAGDLAQILYTSGTTGRPKGVAASHANLVFEYEQRPDPPPLAHSEHAVHAFPLGTNPAQAILVRSLYMRPTTIVLPRFHPERLCELIESYQVGSVFLVPAMWTSLANWEEHDRFDLSSVVLLGSSTAALPPAVAARLSSVFPDAVLVDQYTSTEAWPAQTFMAYDPAKPGSLGRATEGSAIRVTGAEGAEARPGETGEIWLRAPAGLQRSYYGDEDQSAQVFHDGWARTGDLGYLDEEGYLYLVDRESDVVNSGGLKVSTLAVEAALHEHPGVAEAAAVGVPHPTMGQVVAAAVVPRSSLRAEELREALRDSLAEHQVPQRIVTVDALPRNQGGKVLKAKLREQLAPAGRRRGGAGAAATGPVERLLARLWARVLRSGDIRVDDDLIDLGSDSLAAAQVAEAVRQELATGVPLSLFFDFPTVAGQARAIQERLGREPGQEGAAQRAARPARLELREGPLGATQEYWRRWSSADPRHVRPNVFFALRLRGPLDATALERALGEIVRRHDALRTRFTGMVQRVVPAAGLALQVAEPDGGTTDERLRETRRSLEQVAREPFDLGAAPLVRASLFRVAPDDHVLAVAVDHMVADGLSADVLLGELEALYEAYAAGTPPKLPEPALQFLDAIAWERPLLAAERAYWQRELAGAPRYQAGPRHGRPVDRFEPAAHKLAVPGQLAHTLRAASRDASATLYMTLAAVFARVAGHVLGSDDVLLATPVSGRTRPELSGVIGCLFRPVLVRVDLAGRPGLRELVARVRDATLRAYQHQHYPYHEFQSLEQHAARFRFMSAQRPTRLRLLEVARFADDLHLVQHRPPMDGVEPLLPELFMEDYGGVLSGTLLYNRHALDQAAIEEIAGMVLAEARESAVH